MNFLSKYKTFYSWKWIWNYRLRNGGHVLHGQRSWGWTLCARPICNAPLRVLSAVSMNLPSKVSIFGLSHHEYKIAPSLSPLNPVTMSDDVCTKILWISYSLHDICRCCSSSTAIQGKQTRSDKWTLGLKCSSPSISRLWEFIRNVWHLYVTFCLIIPKRVRTRT